MHHNIFATLVKKDLRLIRRQIAVYVSLGLVSIGIMAIPAKHFGHIGSIVLVTALVAFYCHIVMKLIIIERKEKNFELIMTLPVSARDVGLAKLAACSIAFLPVWLFLGLSVFATLSVLTNWPAISLSFYSVIFTIFLPGFLFILAVALVSQSEGWTILSLVFSNVIVTLCINAFPNMDGIKEGFSLGSIAEYGTAWPPIINTILFYEFLTFIFILIACLYHLYRKKDF